MNSPWNMGIPHADYSVHPPGHQKIMSLAQVKGLDSFIYGKDRLVTGCSWLRAADAKCHFFGFTLTHLLNLL